MTITPVNARGMHACGTSCLWRHVMLSSYEYEGTTLLAACTPKRLCVAVMRMCTPRHPLVYTMHAAAAHLNGRSGSHPRESSQLVAPTTVPMSCMLLCAHTSVCRQSALLNCGRGARLLPYGCHANAQPLLHAPIVADPAAIAADRVTWLHQQQCPARVPCTLMK